MTTETIRYILIVGGFLILGFNAAVVLHAAQIVTAVRAWRIFILGKSGFTLFVVISLWQNIHKPLGWLVPVAAVAMALTLASLFMLDHSYRSRRG